MAHMSEAAARLLRHLQSTAIVDPPPPWRLNTEYALGGLTEIGFAENSDYLLVVSSQGRGVFDCTNGQRIARDNESADIGWWYDPNKLTAFGIGPLDGQLIRLAGLHGGGLPNSTRDGWGLLHIWHDWPDNCLVLEEPYKSVYNDLKYGYKIADSKPCEYRAYGFSDTGRSFVFATSCSLYIFSRTQ